MISEEKEQIASILAVRIALMYMMRPNCHMLAQRPRNTIDDKRWESHIRFIQRIFENFVKAGIDEDGELYKIIVARVILACRAKPKRREELLGPILDATDYMLKEMGFEK